MHHDCLYRERNSENGSGENELIRGDVLNPPTGNKFNLSSKEKEQ